MSNQLYQACGNPDNHHERGGPTCIQKCERNRLDLEAAKLPEAELASALEIAREELCLIANWEDGPEDAAECLARITDPSAALAERDRAIEKRTAERCAEIAHGMYPAGWCREKILREFNLEPKPEDE